MCGSKQLLLVCWNHPEPLLDCLSGMGIEGHLLFVACRSHVANHTVVGLVIRLNISVEFTLPGMLIGFGKCDLQYSLVGCVDIHLESAEMVE